MAHLSVTAMLLCTLLSGACVAPRTSPELKSRVEFIAGVPEYVSLGDCGISVQSGAPLFLAEIRNGSQFADCSLQWQVEFYTREGIRVAASDTRWSSVTIRPGSSTQVQLVASNPLAADYKLQLKSR